MSLNYYKSYQCSHCEKTFPDKNKLENDGVENTFICPHCIQTLREPLLVKKSKDKCIKYRVLFFLFMPIMPLTGYTLKNKVILYGTNISLENLAYFVWPIFILVGIAMVVCSIKNPYIIKTEKVT